MKRKVSMGQLVLALGAIATLAIVSPALGGPSLKSLVKKEVAKQIGKARGPAGTAGAAGANGANGADGGAGTARAYAHVFPCSTASCGFELSKGVTQVTRLATGHYCVTAPGISSATETAAATVEWQNTTAPRGNADAQIGLGCTGGEFEVRTERQPSTTVCTTVAGGVCTATANVAGNAVAADDVGWTIVIP
jgi:hypothetical protein